MDDHGRSHIYSQQDSRAEPVSSSWALFVGNSLKHLPLIFNLDTCPITGQYHVVTDYRFPTVDDPQFRRLCKYNTSSSTREQEEQTSYGIPSQQQEQKILRQKMLTTQRTAPV